MIKSEEVLSLDEVRETLKKKEEQMTEKEGKQSKEEESKEREEKGEGRGREEKEEEGERVEGGREGIMGSTLAYAKRFSKLKIEKVGELKEELKKLDIMKLKERHIAKIIDLLPEDTEDLRKIFVGEEVSLDQNEIEKILAVVKKHSK